MSSVVNFVVAFLAFAAVASAQSTELKQFDLIDSSANSNYAAGSIEYHCFDKDSSGNRIYVRGTYGNFGYFEGAVDSTRDTQFNVNWYESATGTLVPTSGAATLNYTLAFDAVNGPYWATGSSDLANSYGQWGSENGVFVTDDSTPAGVEEILAKCLYPGVNAVAARDSVAALDGTVSVSGSSAQGQNTLCEMPAGTPGGSWLGTYQYVYGENDGDATEIGNYGTNPFAFWVTSGMGFVGSWHASTGPIEGDYGTNLYMVVADASTTHIVGFYCSIDASTLERTDCFQEAYEVSSADANPDSCPYNYRLDGTLDPLYDFASTGSDESRHENRRRVPVALAIFFGVFSGVLLIIIAVLVLTRPTAAAPAGSSAVETVEK